MTKLRDQEKKQDDNQVSLRLIRGVGPHRLKLLKALGITSKEELVNFFPRRYEDRVEAVAIDKVISEDEPVLVIASFLSKKKIITRNRKVILKAVATDGASNFDVVWFNAKFMSDELVENETVAFYGKVKRINGVPTMHHPDTEVLNKKGARRIHTCRIVPFYSLSESLNQKLFRSMVYELLLDELPEIEDPIPLEVRNRLSLVNLKFALKNIHFPKTANDLKKAHRRLVFDEFITVQLAIAYKKKNQQGIAGKDYDLDKGIFDNFKALFPFELTSDQKKIAEEINQDLVSGARMQRLVQGDVGSGKTVVALYALYANAKAGFQGVIMAPTEILAQQHYLSFNRFLAPEDTRVAILTQAQTKLSKERLLSDAASGKIDILIGTHSLIQEGVEFKDLRMIVIDEQHKFGVVQRERLLEKGNRAHLLVMSATPIPQTLAMTLYGDMEVSTIKLGATTRDNVATFLFDTSLESKNKLDYLIQKEISDGGQVYIVCPRLDLNQNQAMLSAKERFEQIIGSFPSVKASLLHGKMSSVEKDVVMKSFASGDIKILVTTTVVEVGLDVKNATLMIIENAERFGLSQLHQLRGRVGRGERPGLCALVTNNPSEKTQERLEGFLSTNSGFEIAEKDLKLRGPGDWIGERQHGMPQLRIGDPISDYSILDSAHEEANRIINSDPKLTKKEHARWRSEIFLRYKKLL